MPGLRARTKGVLMAARRLLVRGGHLLTMDALLGDLTGDLLVEDGVIRAVAPSIDGGDAEVVDGLKRVYGFSRVAV